jgi:hypothetical protein
MLTPFPSSPVTLLHTDYYILIKVTVGKLQGGGNPTPGPRGFTNIRLTHGFWLPPAHPDPLPANIYEASPIPPAMPVFG